MRAREEEEGLFLEIPDDIEARSVAARMMPPAMETVADLTAYQMADAAMKMLDQQRRQQNNRLLAIYAAWKDLRRTMREKILNVLAKYGETTEKGTKVSTLLGTTYKLDQPARVKILDEQKAISWMRANDRPVDTMTVEHLTETGKKQVIERALALVELTGEEIPGVEVVPPSESVATRYRSNLKALIDRPTVQSMVGYVPALTDEKPAEEEEAPGEPKDE